MKFKYITSLALVSTMLFTSCLGDLDTKPLNESDFTSDKAYESPDSYFEGLAKIYGGFVLVGESEGTPDIAVADAGASEFNRAYWSLNELSTDEGKCAWVNDAWVAEINTNSWSNSKNDAVFAIYNRGMMLVTYVNEYLRQTTDEKLASRGVSEELKKQVHAFRAEAKFMRAYAYWILLDVFGNVPFVTEESPTGAFIPEQIKRADLFEYVKTQLVALTTDGDLAEPRTNQYPRVDKAAAWGLLARLYLNGEVYTGKAYWAEAKEAASKVTATGYALASNYKALFMGDNGQNEDTKKELIFAIDYDKEFTKSYGGTSFLVTAAMSNKDTEGKALIGSDGWGGIRTSYPFVAKFFGVTDADFNAGTFKCNDKRGLFHIKGKTKEMDDTGNIDQGVAVIKFSNLDTKGENKAAGAFSSTDYPMMRLAEIYLIYAEANLRAGGAVNDATAVNLLKKLRDRAIINPTESFVSYDLDYIFNERTRELFWEGHRRTDLIRFGKFTGSTYQWQWKGGIKDGKAIPEYMNLCAIPSEDLSENPNLVQNPGFNN